MSLPIRTDELFGPLPAGAVRGLEVTHGNGDLIRVLEALGIAGPFEVLSPWELRAPDGHHLINAGGYAALPFGELYPPLVTFMQRYLRETRAMSLPQQSASAWRGALETNLVALLSRHAPSHADSQVFFPIAARRPSRRRLNLSGPTGRARPKSSTLPVATTARRWAHCL